MIIHRTDLAGYSWDVLRNSWGTERSYLLRDTKPKLRSAAWLQSEAARKLVAMGGLDLDKLFEEAQSKDFKPVELPMRLQARSQPSAPVRREKCTCGIAFQGFGGDRSSALCRAVGPPGRRPDRNGQNIFNGAVDNATGCAALLELARTWSQTTKAPSA